MAEDAFVHAAIIRIDKELQKLSGQSESSPTPAAVGRLQYEVLVENKAWVKLEREGPSVLTWEESEILVKKESESGVIQFLTPYLQKITEQASLDLGLPLRLVNSERHCWIQSSGLKKLAPDMFICHPAFYQLDRTSKDKEFDGEGFLFGKLADNILRDGLEVCAVEGKVHIGPQDFEALGDGINYSSCISIFGRTQEADIPLDKTRIMTNKVMLIASNGFWLVTCRGGQALKCEYGSWTDPGSTGSILLFIKERTQETPRRWETAIEKLLSKLGLSLLEPAYGNGISTCFLGRGGGARVFRVLNRNGEECALKCVSSEKEWRKLRVELDTFKELKDNLEQSDCAVKLCGSFVEKTERSYAGLLFQPVGVKLPQSKTAIESAINGLKALCLAGICHHDARKPNVIWSKEKAVWLDFESAYSVETAAEKEEAFVSDLQTFVASFGEGIDTMKQEFRLKAVAFWSSGSRDIFFNLSVLWK
jgi:hypothetical protein